MGDLSRVEEEMRRGKGTKSSQAAKAEAKRQKALEAKKKSQQKTQSRSRDRSMKSETLGYAGMGQVCSHP
jgi:hypothetical protein